MSKTHWLLSVIILLLAVGLTFYANDLARQASERRQGEEQKGKAARQKEYLELKERHSTLNIDLGSAEDAIETFCHPGSTKATPAGYAFDKAQCEMAQGTRSGLLRQLAQNEQEMRDWVTANQGK